MIFAVRNIEREDIWDYEGRGDGDSGYWMA